MVKLFDCTVRDGGHLNGWNFSIDFVSALYHAAIEAGVDYFEIGYRFDNPRSDWGYFAHCDDIFLKKTFQENDKCKIAVMIDAGKCSSNKFQKCNIKNTIIKTIRIATYPDKLNLAFKLCEDLKDKGYEILINFMAISKYKKEDFEKIKNWKNKNILKSAYFADSFGAFLPEDVTLYQNKLKSLGFENVSFHAHNNLQMAFANSIKAIENDFYSIDASIYGMGRGAGILPMELVLGYFNKKEMYKYNPIPYFNVIEKYYYELSNNIQWGYQIPSLIGGFQNIHPNYIKELFDKKIKPDKIWNITDKLKEKETISYNSNVINELLNN